jgi:hypothetical protein
MLRALLLIGAGAAAAFCLSRLLLDYVGAGESFLRAALF